MILGVEAVLQAFASQFADPSFGTYLRQTERIELDPQGARAAETGRWTATGASEVITGTYLAVWQKVTDQWVIESELYVIL